MESTNQQVSMPKWQAVNSIDRRVMGVLAEKSKTTPDAYPMTINALVNGCNQKSNRSPLMQLSSDDVEESLERLRLLGAAAEIQTSGRVPKYRHYLYEWLGVDRAEMAVMVELLLRGDQTMGELRGRVARMEPIADLTALRPIVDALKKRGLIIPLTPEGRGHVVTHNLYKDKELEKLRARYGEAAVSAGHDQPAAESADKPSPPMPQPFSGDVDGSHEMPETTASITQGNALSCDIGELRQEVTRLCSDIDQLRDQFEDLLLKCEQTEDELRELKDSLGA